jgi:hypothetical protein
VKIVLKLTELVSDCLTFCLLTMLLKMEKFAIATYINTVIFDVDWCCVYVIKSSATFCQ